MNRVVLFAHFDQQNEVKGYILHHLEALGRLTPRIVFVSTSALDEGERAKLRPLVETVLLKDNTGMDFGMWRHALERVDLAGCDELVLVNSSVFGPLFPLEPIFERMSADPCDFWGMTDNFEHVWHLQSYFLVFKRPVLESPSLRLFFGSVLAYRTITNIILSYEVGLTSYLKDNGFQGAAFAPIDAWAPKALRRKMDRERMWNPTLFHPERVLAQGMPYVKALLLRDNPADVPLEPVRRMMKESGYDMDLVTFDRRHRAVERRGRLASASAKVLRRLRDSAEDAAASIKQRPR
jgi:lipopolysaccharide biosynthesis protein